MSNAFVHSGSVVIGSLASDPSNARNGEIYYNTGTNKWRVRLNGSFEDVVDQAQITLIEDSIDDLTAADVAYARADINKKNIQPSSDDVESALNDLDDAIGALDQTPVNYTPVDPAIVADHLAAIDTALAGAGSVEYADDVFRIYDNGDNTKKIAFEASTIATATTRTITMPNTNVDLGQIATNTAAISDVVTDVADLVTLSGVAANATDLGTFTGATIPDGSDNKEALQSLETAIEAHVADSSDAHAASAITNTPSGNLAATNVQTALNELQSDIDTRALDSAVIKKNGSVAFTADQSMGSFKLTNLADPVGDQDAATKAYVTAVSMGLKPKQSVRVVAITNIVIASALENGDTVDGVVLATGNRVLLAGQTLPEENGIYVVAASGAASRALDFDSVTPIDEINGSWVSVQEGTGAGKVYVQYGLVTTVGTDAINFTATNGLASLVGGDMITLSGSTISVDLATVSGLESTNPGNNAGQLRNKLEASNPSLQISGSNELGVKLNAAGAITKGASGIQAVTDGSTLEISSNALRVKDAGITDAKIATGIDAAKIADGSVSNAEFQFINTLTSNAQTQINGKLANVVEDLTPELGGDLDVLARAIQSSTSEIVLAGQNSVRRAKVATKTDFIEEEYIHATALSGSQTNTVITALTFAFATYEALEITYKVKEATSNDIRIGTLRVLTNGTAVVYQDQFTETADTGITFDAVVNGSNINVRYSSGSNGATLRMDIKRIKA